MRRELRARAAALMKAPACTPSARSESARRRSPFGSARAPARFCTACGAAVAVGRSLLRPVRRAHRGPRGERVTNAATVARAAIASCRPPASKNASAPSPRSPASTSRSPPARWSPCSGPTARARRHCCASSPASRGRAPDPCTTPATPIAAAPAISSATSATATFLYPQLTARENLALHGAALRRRERRAARVATLLDELELERRRRSRRGLVLARTRAAARDRARARPRSEAAAARRALHRPRSGLGRSARRARRARCAARIARSCW